MLTPKCSKLGSLLLALAVVAAAALVGCTSGTSTPPRLDGGGDTFIPDAPPPDMGADSPQLPDITLPDLWIPDLAVSDTVSPDLGPCGNGKLDPGEECDRAIAAGDPGACPTAADCDDQNKCTTDTLQGSSGDCTAKCVNTPIANCCGNGTVEGTEECDDGNVSDKDGCSNLCKLPGGHLLITELSVSPSEAEFIEIYNPSNTAVSLDDIYIADRNDYFLLSKQSLPSQSTDFVAGFPAGATLAPGAYAVVAIAGGLNFKIAFGKAPDYELTNTDTTVPDMVAPAKVPNAIGSQAGLTDTGELAILFRWDGTSDLVEDIDYVVWKGSSATAVFKNSAICVDGIDADQDTTCYLDDTSVIQQSYLTPPKQGGSIHRCDYHEGSETQTGGNGLTGHDETSEPLASGGATWKRNPNTLSNRSPGAPAPAGFCPQ